MASPRTPARTKGFSLVEMLVALVFTMVLMAGMASVFKASLTNFFTSGESVSSGRRNRMSLDTLRNDINNAAMYLVNITTAPPTNASYPPIFILPNQPVLQLDGTTNLPPHPDPLDPTTSDQLAFYLDQPLPFEGTLASGTTQLSANSLVNNAQNAPNNPQAGTTTSDDLTYYIECHTTPYAGLVQTGQTIIFKDNFESSTFSVSSPIPATSSQVTVVESSNGTASMTGQPGGSGLPSRFQHSIGAQVVFVRSAQMVLYQVKMLQLDMDPNKPNGIPCLVRDQYNYNDVVAAGGFVGPVPTVPEEIIAENVGFRDSHGVNYGFKVYMSCNAGASWAGLGLTQSGWAGWSTAITGIRALLDAQLSTSGRPGYTTTENTEQWFRSIPTLIRCDITTRTATKRSEYSTTPTSANPTASYKPFTQSLVFEPRHSGLPMD
jgi:Tfp pilus assembly protein PilW